MTPSRVQPKAKIAEAYREHLAEGQRKAIATATAPAAPVAREHRVFTTATARAATFKAVTTVGARAATFKAHAVAIAVEEQASEACQANEVAAEEAPAAEFMS